MVKEVTKSVNKEQLFDEVVIAVVSQSPDEKKIQAEIADKLGLKFEEESVSRRADRLRESLPSKRILVILDDVWKRLELNDIGIPYREGHGGCKILLTSRFVYICDDMGVEEKFIVEALDREEAWNLFKETAGISNDTSTEFYATQKVVADECGGLLVALRQLQGHSKVNESIHGILLLFNYREDFDIPIEDLVRYGIGLESFEDIATVGEARQKVHDFVDDLKKCYLLMDSEEEEYVKMHNVIRDVAISIASGEEHSFMVRYDKALEDWPQHRLKNYVVISLKLNGMHGLLGNLEFRKLQLLKLDCNADLDNGMEEVQVQETPDCFYQGMKELRVLALSNLYGSLLTSLRCLTNL
ncbi:disease resistance protein RPS2-like [Camellia sinensis]|uniref:disease resistance protein RPS2-like n=1 Tax=Camellia sinensis TaxID=4442 RepID=UPI00103553BB|nr:disease resistance protein RPS2-like [Camellia sinensis]